jgi:hypothetical protein
VSAILRHPCKVSRYPSYYLGMEDGHGGNQRIY